MTAPRRLLASHASVALLDSAATRALEQRAAADLPPHELMRRAGVALLRLARAVAPHARSAWVAAGPGNNGGDGLVLATLLRRAGMAVSVSLVGHAAQRARPADAAWALQEARAAGVTLLDTLPDAAALARVDLCVDALFGVGQTRAPQGEFATAIEALNACAATLLAVDLPTGLCGDSGAALGEHVVRATHTLALLSVKPGLFTGAGREFAGEPWFCDLGVAQPAPLASMTTLCGADRVVPLLPRRRHLANKGSFGDVHVAGGAAGMVGASLLAGRAAATAGAGRVFVHMRASDAGVPLPVDLAHPELMLRPLVQLPPALRENPRATVVAGCGGGADVGAELPAYLSHACRLVLDADALNAVARDAGLRAQLRTRAQRGLPTILTPHPLEAARLLGSTAAQVQADRAACARRLAADTGAVVVLKGSGTLVASPDGRVSVNPSGDARLASAGTGDVLAGWIGGLWAAQPHEPAAPPATAADTGTHTHPTADAETDASDTRQAGALLLAQQVAAAAVFVHGRSCAVARDTRLPLVASALIAAIAQAVRSLDD